MDPLTRTDIYNKVTSLLSGNAMDEDLFDMFLDTAQSYWENMRNWVWLRAVDESQTVTAGNSYTTEKNLPSDFRKWYSRFPIVLIDPVSGNVEQQLAEVPLNKKNLYKDKQDRFYAKYATSKLFLCGRPSKTSTIQINYIQRSEAISADDGNTWIFPSEFHNILPLTIATYWKLGVDYDIINNSQANEHARIANNIYNNMADWDGSLIESTLEGQDYTNENGGGYFSENGGRLSMLG